MHAPRDSNNLALLRMKSLQQKVEPQPDMDAFISLPQMNAELRVIQMEAQQLTKAIKDLKGKFKPVK